MRPKDIHPGKREQATREGVIRCTEQVRQAREVIYVRVTRAGMTLLPDKLEPSIGVRRIVLHRRRLGNWGHDARLVAARYVHG